MKFENLVEKREVITLKNQLTNILKTNNNNSIIIISIYLSFKATRNTKKFFFNF